MNPELMMGAADLIENTVEFVDENKEWMAAVGLVVIGLAFSKKVRDEIFRRDGGADVWNGVKERLDAAHINHDKLYELYNHASNGRMLTIRNHFIDHMNRHGRNGLDKLNNTLAMIMLWKRMNIDERKGLKPPWDRD